MESAIGASRTKSALHGMRYDAGKCGKRGGKWMDHASKHYCSTRSTGEMWHKHAGLPGQREMKVGQQTNIFAIEKPQLSLRGSDREKEM